MKAIQNAVRARDIKLAEFEAWANRELNPLLDKLRRFANLNLNAPRFAIAQVVGSGAGEWQLCEFGVTGADLTQADVTALVADGNVRTLPLGALSAPAGITVSNVGASRGYTWELYKLDTSGNAYTVTLGADVIVLPGASMWHVEARFNAAAAWEALRVRPLTVSG